MTITRVEFAGFSVVGPNKRSFPAYKPLDWPNWTVAVEGPSLVFEGEGRRIEVARSRCTIYSEVEKVAKPVDIVSHLPRPNEPPLGTIRAKRP